MITLFPILICWVVLICGECSTKYQLHPDRPAATRTLPTEQTHIPGEFLIKLDNTVLDSDDFTTNKLTKNLTTSFGIEVKKAYAIGAVKFLHVFTNHVIGSKEIGDQPLVEYLTPNQRISLNSEYGLCENHSNPFTWGLDRIDQREELAGDRYDINATYIYSSNDLGQGVNVYVVDSGIDMEHPDLEGRAEWGHTAIGMDGDLDLNGHGTHVAGIVGSLSYGVAKRCNLLAVKVLDEGGRGNDATLFDGLQWVYNDHVEKYNQFGKMPKSIVNLSLGKAGVDPLYSAVIDELINRGITVVVSAGNDNDDACQYSPAHVPDAITVAASDETDSTVFTSFTNWGTCVDIFAPGTSILSTFPKNLHPEGLDYEVKSGTSMAAPHVSGVVARYLSTQNITPDPHDVSTWLRNIATEQALFFFTADHRKSPNMLVYTPCDSSVSGSYRNKLSGMLTFIIAVIYVKISCACEIAYPFSK